MFDFPKMMESMAQAGPMFEEAGSQLERIAAALERIADCLEEEFGAPPKIPTTDAWDMEPIEKMEVDRG